MFIPARVSLNIFLKELASSYLARYKVFIYLLQQTQSKPDRELHPRLKSKLEIQAVAPLLLATYNPTIR